MTFPRTQDLDAIIAALEGLRAVEANASSVNANAVSDADADAVADAGAALTEAQQLVQALAALGAVRAAFDAATLRWIAALERACSADPEADPVRAAGHGDIGSLLAELWRTSLPAARQLCAVARATAPRHSLHGEELPAEFPVLATALLGHPTGGDSTAEASTVDGDPEGSAAIGAADPTASVGPRVSVEQAAVIVRELTKTGPGCTLEQRAMGERALVAHAPGFTVEQLRKLAVQVRDRLDQDGTEPREELQRRRRSLTITTTRDGMAHIDWYLDAESAGHVIPQITAYVSQDYRTTRDQKQTPSAGVRFQDSFEPDASEGETTPEMPEPRSLAQIRSDGAVEVFRHRAGCTSGLTTPPVTMIVRVSLADLRAGAGTAEIDEIPTPVSAGTARRLAADANIIPLVLGRRSEVLDLGRSKRLFSPAQKHALAERDGGCAWIGCPHPPAYTQAHHIRWWDRDTGPTDLNNGILLCSTHHHRIHNDGWDITVHHNTPWFTPPAHHDPTRTPRRGGRIHIPDSAPP